MQQQCLSLQEQKKSAVTNGTLVCYDEFIIAVTITLLAT